MSISDEDVELDNESDDDKRKFNSSISFITRS